MKSTLIAIVVVVALGLGIGIGYFMGGKGEEEQTEKADQGTSQSDPSKKTIPYRRDISKKNITAKLPMDIGPLKELASKDDPESIQKAIDIHKKGEISTRTVIEMEARNNSALKEENSFILTFSVSFILLINKFCFSKPKSLFFIYLN